MTTPDSATVTDHTRQWLEKAVIGLNLCPFAKAPHVKNLVRISVSQARHLDGFLEDLDRELQLLGDTPADELETTLLVHPTLFPDFDTFNQMLDIADAAVVDNGLEGIVQIAPFHPDFQFEGTDSDDIGNYTNRSPHPAPHPRRQHCQSRTSLPRRLRHFRAQHRPARKNGTRRLGQARYSPLPV